jgi:hypothetical protein
MSVFAASSAKPQYSDGKAATAAFEKVFKGLEEGIPHHRCRYTLRNHFWRRVELQQWYCLLTGIARACTRVRYGSKAAIPLLVGRLNCTFGSAATGPPGPPLGLLVLRAKKDVVVTKRGGRESGRLHAAVHVSLSFQVSPHNVEELLGRLGVQRAGMFLGVHQVRAHVVLDHLGH